MRTPIAKALLALLSAGWLVPLWLGIGTYLTFVRYEVWPLLEGQHPLNSFPFLDFTSRCLTISIAWLGLVIVFWAYRLLGLNSSSRAD